MIYGIDPGTYKSAIVGINENYEIKFHDLMDNKDVEFFLQNVGKSKNYLSIEWLQSYGMVVGQDVFLTCRWVGRFEKSFNCDKNTYLYTRPNILLHITGGKRGKGKAQVRQACMIRFGGTKKGEPLHGMSNHKWDAFAVAVTHLDVLNNPGLNHLICNWTDIKGK